MKGEALSQAQGIPLKFLENILGELKHAGLVRSQRGAEGGYWLARPADEITIADVIRAVEGPLASVRGEAPETVKYGGAAEPLGKLWVAVRANLRAVLEEVTVADVAAASYPRSWTKITSDPRPGSGTRRSAGRLRLAGRLASSAKTRDVPGRTNTIWPSCSSSWSASARVSCAQACVPSWSENSTRTSNPRCTILSIIASSVVPLGSSMQLEVVRADERVAEAVHRPDEAHHELVRRLLVQLARLAHLLHAAVVHHHDLLGDVHRLLLVVRDEDRRHVHLVVQAAQPDAQVLAHPRVERAERLVEQQHLGLDGERARERHALALAARQLVG